jgi:hypothetical protein
MSTRKKSAIMRRRPLAYQTWAMARVAQEIRRIRPAVKPTAATEAAIRFMSEVFEAEGEKPIPIEYVVRVKKALQTLENRKAEVTSFAFFEAWHVVQGEPSDIRAAADEAIRRFIDP